MKRGIGGYVLCLAAVALLVLPFIQDGWRSLAAGAQWRPAPINETVPMPLTIFFVIGPALAFIVTLLRWARAPGQSRAVGARAALVAAIVALYACANSVVDKARATWDAHSRELLGQLRPGMARAQVDQACAAAALLTGLHLARSVTGDDTAVYSRSYNQGFGSDDMTGYALRLQYTPGGKLEQVSYETSHYLEDRYDRCEVLAETPARAGRQYPYTCLKKP